MPSLTSQELEAKAQQIRALILDVDGVLTDGRITYITGGGDSKTFHVRDGLGIQLMIANGYPVAAISGRESDVVVRRARELGVRPLLQGVLDKVEAFERTIAELEVPAEEIAYVGDDLPDLPLIGRSGLGFAPADAAPEVRAAADFVLRSGGGQGCVREACEWLLKAKGAWKM